MQRPRPVALLLAISLLTCAAVGRAQTRDANEDTSGLSERHDESAAATQTASLSVLGHDIAAYYTAPLHWDTQNWVYFGSAIALTAAAHHYDTDVRNHFTRNSPDSGLGTKSYELQDAIPTVAVVAATSLGAALWDHAGFEEAGAMVEAGALSTATAYGLKYAAGREGPDETTDPNRWRAGGSSFPSFHATVAFAVGTVLAESGSDEYRWLRRFLGYGIGGFTVYERLKHNAHWLSDTVAGAALGDSTARFVMHRRDHGTEESSSSFMIAPLPGGVMVTYTADLSR